MMNMNGPVTKEVHDLAEHHKEILERRFPNYDHSIKTHSPWIFVRTKHRGTTILEVIFTSSSIAARTFFMGHDIALDYANPEFTDDTRLVSLNVRPHRYERRITLQCFR